MNARVFRPRRALLMAVLLSVVLVAAAAFGWLALPAHIQVLFTVPQLLTLAFFIAVMIAFMMSIGLSEVRLDSDGLRYRNGLRTHQLAWTEVRGFRFTENDPWAYVLVDADPDSRPLLGIQRSDHGYADAQLAEVVAAWRTATSK